MIFAHSVENFLDGAAKAKHDSSALFRDESLTKVRKYANFSHLLPENRDSSQRAKTILLGQLASGASSAEP